ncbi:MAG: hypothetical protein J6V66_06605, partial [Clostridia bacterium]|nr:hypothetical protein [Clostridia bacterium]
MDKANLLLKKRKQDKLDLSYSITEMDELFNDSASNGKEQGFVSKLLKKDFKNIVYITILFLFQGLPTWVVPLFTSEIIDLITVRPEG